MFLRLMLCNRFVDRDMLMRYHWSMGVGHTYCHESLPKTTGENQQNNRNEETGFEEGQDKEIYLDDENGNGEQLMPASRDDHDELQYELGERENEDLGESEPEDIEVEDELDDEAFLALEDMYDGSQALM